MLKNTMPRYEPLSLEALATIHDGWERLGKEVGVQFDNDEALRLFRRAGQTVEDTTVFFDPDFLLAQAKLAPAEFSMRARNAARDLTIGGDSMIFCAAQGPPFVRIGDERRDGTYEDLNNLPYSVATPLILRSIPELPLVDRWCVMVQREIADRLFAEPSTPAYGAVSVLMRLGCVRTDLHPVGRMVFDPPPRVDSALVAFRRHDDWPVLAPSWERIAHLVHAGFAHRRKTLANGIAMAGIATRAEAEQTLVLLGRDPRIRAEAIEPDGWPSLLNALDAATVVPT